MNTRRVLFAGVVFAGLALVAVHLADSHQRSAVRQRSASTTTTSAASSPSAKGPEAGVWVIAETTDLPTKFVKIVVTDDRGRYVLPDLPKANYNVWVRGYGLVDSPKVQGAPGKVAEPDGGRRAQRRAPRPSTTRQATGSR